MTERDIPVKKQTRREFLKTVGSIAASAAALSELTGCVGIGQIMGTGTERPNIIFIMTDDHASQALKKWKYQRYIKDYLRCVASVDDNVGWLLDYLDASGLAENTIVVYTSDQGFFLGEHGWFDKRFMYEQSLRMPLLMRYPKEIEPGLVSNDIVLNLDFAPTFLDFAGVAKVAGMQGRSIRQLLRGRAPKDWRTSMYYHYYEYPGAHSVKRHYGVRTKRYKLIHFYYDIDAWELYDLQKDPNELNNVYDDPLYAETVRQLKAELQRLRNEFRIPKHTL